MAASAQNFELEAAKFLHKLIQDSTYEPVKLATKLHVILLHVKSSSGKEQSMPCQVILRIVHLELRRRGLKVAVVGIPKTKDNDIPVIDKSFGFDTIVEEAQRAINAVHAEAESFENAWYWCYQADGLIQRDSRIECKPPSQPLSPIRPGLGPSLSEQRSELAAAEAMDSDLDLHFAFQEALAASSSSSTLPNLQRQQPLPDDAVGKFCAKPKGDSDIDEDEPQIQIVDDVDKLISCICSCMCLIEYSRVRSVTMPYLKCLRFFCYFIDAWWMWVGSTGLCSGGWLLSFPFFLFKDYITGESKKAVENSASFILM
ncbi:hypothetical protein RIF29_00725 [Crotalaria pallida]|uniref:Phosphofructokinase domain-containing protein n=1 Tax=Crotalaria pallida TaxID=3830 RepID=A0AAN9P778_CROPI